MTPTELLVALRHEGATGALLDHASVRLALHRPGRVVEPRADVARQLAAGHASGVHAERAIAAPHPFLPGDLHGLRWEDAAGRPHLALWHLLDGRLIEAWEACPTDQEPPDPQPGDAVVADAQVPPPPGEGADAPLTDWLSRADASAAAFHPRAVLRLGAEAHRGRDAIRAALAHRLAGTVRSAWLPGLSVAAGPISLHAGHALRMDPDGAVCAWGMLAWFERRAGTVIEAVIQGGGP